MVSVSGECFAQVERAAILHVLEMGRNRSTSGLVPRQVSGITHDSKIKAQRRKLLKLLQASGGRSVACGGVPPAHWAVSASMRITGGLGATATNTRCSTLPISSIRSWARLQGSVA
ncbi:hypothetical protein [Phaeobacter sp. C3_T13_0]|uniref:hypothetical protein n=1 Tax=Phaeobacter cretensis TaxID=3342641 RepID=UPI0039BC9096